MKHAQMENDVHLKISLESFQVLVNACMNKATTQHTGGWRRIDYLRVLLHCSAQVHI